MTLNITVVSPNRVYQCSDYRFTDLVSRGWRDLPQNQKIQLASFNHWHASVAFNGLAESANGKTVDWLSNVIATCDREIPHTEFLRRLKTADELLRGVAIQDARLSFLVAGFSGVHLFYAVVSNYEGLSGAPLPYARRELEIFVSTPKGVKVFVNGQAKVVNGAARERLKNLASIRADPEQMMNLLATLNAQGARANKAISSGCFTAWMDRTGAGTARPNGVELVGTVLPGNYGAASSAVTDVLDKQFGAGKWQMKQMAFMKSEPNEEFLKAKIEENPKDANAYSNFGLFLLEQKKDPRGAERAYLAALELDQNNPFALGNLASLRWQEGQEDEAESLYRRGWAAHPGIENIGYGFGRFLDEVRGDPVQGFATIEIALNKSDQSARLVQAGFELALKLRRWDWMFRLLNKARELRVDQSSVELHNAFALHLSGASSADCVAAYRTAIALNPKELSPRLNLAQLLLAAGMDEGQKNLRDLIDVVQDEPSRIEANFYVFAHCAPTRERRRETLNRLLASVKNGGRLDWDVSMNIAAATKVNSEFGRQVADLAEILRIGSEDLLLRFIASQ